MRTTLAVAILALLLAPVTWGGSLAMAGHDVAGLPHECGQMMPCEQQDGSPFTPLPCPVTTLHCGTPALIDEPYSLDASGIDVTAAPAPALSLHTQRTRPVSTPPPRS